MPTIYKGECKACGAISSLSQDGHLACRLDNGDVKPLPHPMEALTLEELGFTYEQAKKDHRLVWVTNVVCDSCGHIAERHDVKSSESCLVHLAMIVAALTTCVTFLPMPWGLFAGLLWIYAFLHFYSAIERYLARDAQELLSKPPICPNCTDAQYQDFSKILSKKSVCRSCGQQEVKYEFKAIS